MDRAFRLYFSLRDSYIGRRLIEEDDSLMTSDSSVNCTLDADFKSGKERLRGRSVLQYRFKDFMVSK